MLDHQIKQENYELPQRQDFRILWGGGTKPLHGLITFQIPNLIFWVLPSMYWLSKFDFRTMGDWDQVGFIKRWRILSFQTILPFLSMRSGDLLKKFALSEALHLENIGLLLRKPSQLRSTLEFGNGYAEGLKAKKILGGMEKIGGSVMVLINAKLCSSFPKGMPENFSYTVIFVHFQWQGVLVNTNVMTKTILSWMTLTPEGYNLSAITSTASTLLFCTACPCCKKDMPTSRTDLNNFRHQLVDVDLQIFKMQQLK